MGYMKFNKVSYLTSSQEQVLVQGQQQMYIVLFQVYF